MQTSRRSFLKILGAVGVVPGVAKKLLAGQSKINPVIPELTPPDETHDSWHKNRAKFYFDGEFVGSVGDVTICPGGNALSLGSLEETVYPLAVIEFAKMDIAIWQGKEFQFKPLNILKDKTMSMAFEEEGEKTHTWHFVGRIRSYEPNDEDRWANFGIDLMGDVVMS